MCLAVPELEMTAPTQPNMPVTALSACTDEIPLPSTLPAHPGTWFRLWFVSLHAWATNDNAFRLAQPLAHVRWFYRLREASTGARCPLDLVLS